MYIGCYFLRCIHVFMDSYVHTYVYPKTKWKDKACLFKWLPISKVREQCKRDRDRS